MDFSGGWMWYLVTVFGAALLGVVLFIGQRSSERFKRNPGAVAKQEQATKQLWQDEAKREAKDV